MTEATREEAFTGRLAAVQTRRRTRAPMLVGSVLAPLGLVLIGLAWLGASNTPVLQEQVAYLISGGLVGLALVVVGSFLYFSHWQTQQLQLTRAQTQQLTGALQGIQATLDQLATTLAASQPALLATPGGTISHLATCRVVARRTDLRSVASGEQLAPCSICQAV